MGTYQLLILALYLSVTELCVQGSRSGGSDETETTLRHNILKSTLEHIPDEIRVRDVTFSIQDIVRSLKRTGIDYAYLMREQNEICSEIPRKCGNCSCVYDCGMTNTCCPDCPYAFLRSRCYDVAIIGKDIRQLVGECPVTFEGATEVKELCSSNSSELAPVSSGNLDFNNKHCAKCYGVDVDATWEIVLNCSLPIPETLHVDEYLGQNLDHLGCVASFQYPTTNDTMNERSRYPCDMDAPKYTIGKCNVSGLWEESDPNLVWGCENMDTLSEFDSQFKNVFCYLCNPSIASTTKLDDIQLCNFCPVETLRKRLLPYGTKCLMSCNNVFDRIRNLRVNDTNTVRTNVIEHVDTKTGESSVSVDMTIINFSEIFSKIQPILSELYENDILLSSVNQNYMRDNSYHKTHASLQKQIRTYVAICGDRFVCDKSWLSENSLSENENRIHAAMHPSKNDSYLSGKAYSGFHNKSSDQQDTPVSYNNPVCGRYCTCDPICVINGTCCVETLIIEEPLACYMEHEFYAIYPTGNDNLFNINLNSEKNYSIISRCVNKSSTYLTSMCSGKASQIDILNYLPVHSHKLTFKNIYCLMCYFEYPDAIVVSLQLNCASYLETNLFPDVYTMLKSTRDKCKVTFMPSYINPCEKPYSEYMNVSATYMYYSTNSSETFSSNNFTFVYTCNVTGHWYGDDGTIKRLCEADSESMLRLPDYRIDAKVYKNFACFECNPDVPMTTVSDVEVIGNCTDPRGLYEKLQALCVQRPYHSRWLPYKNVYCARCNTLLLPVGIYQAMVPISSIGKGEPRKKTYTYRDLFSPQEVSRRPILSEASTCSGIFDSKQNVCHRLTCDQGRVLVNGSCRWKCPETLARPTDDDRGPVLQHRVDGTIDNTKLRRPYPPSYSPSDTAGTITELFTPVSSVSNVNQMFVFPVNNNPNLYYKLRVRITTKLQVASFEFDEVVLEEICRNLLSNVLDILDELDPSYTCAIFNTSCGPTNITLHDKGSLMVAYDIKAPSVYVSDLENALVKSLNGESIVRTASGINMSLVSFPVSKQYVMEANVSSCTYEYNWNGFSSFGKMIYVDKFLTCPYILLNKTDIEFDNNSNSILLHGNTIIIASEDYERVGNTVKICKDEYNNSQVSNKHAFQRSIYDNVYVIFNKVCAISSIVCLFLTFVTFSVFKTLRTIPGKNIMTLTLSLFLSQLLIIVGPLISTDGLGCAIFGAFIHFCWLSTFCAMCACSFHMFRLFYINFMSPPSQGVGENYTVAKYNMAVFGLPLVVVLIVISYHVISTNGEFAGYGKTQFCFLAGFYPILFAFVLPSLVITMTSVILFSMSFHQIRTAPHMSSNRDRRDVVICIKLSVIVGLAWPLQVLDGILDLSVLSFIVVALNGLQGVFIFAAYICNARILGLYRGFFCTSSETSSNARRAII